MASTLPILLLLCACTFALPKERFARAVNYCAPQTPCSWKIFDANSKVITQEVQNIYCLCAEDRVCTKDEVDYINYSLIYRCRASENTS